MSGGVIGAVRHDDSKIIVPFGTTTGTPGATPIHEDSIFDIASITKSIPISSLGLKLYENGIIDIEDQVIKYLPEFNNNYRESLLLKHLFLQTIDCSYRLSQYKHGTPEEMLQVVLTGDFNNPPGSAFFPTNAATILLGLVIERATNQPLPELSENIFFSDYTGVRSGMRMSAENTEPSADQIPIPCLRIVER